MDATTIEDVFALAAAPPLAVGVDHFYFVRHGQTQGNFDRIYQFPTIELNQTGIRQAEAAAERLNTVAFREIVASDYRRAHRTAEIIAQATGRKLTVETDLRERFFGDLLGTPWTEIDWTVHPPGGESLEEFISRTKRGAERALAQPGEPPLLVAHGGTLRVLVAALGAMVEEAARNNATPLAFERDGQGWRVTLV